MSGHDLSRSLSLWSRIVVATSAGLWLGLSTVLLASRGRPESWLVKGLVASSQPDAFEFLDRALPLFWLVHTLLMVMASVAMWHHRADVVAILSIGPILATMIGLLTLSWSDPNWFVLLTTGTIGWLIGLVAAAACWISKPRNAPVPRVG